MISTVEEVEADSKDIRATWDWAVTQGQVQRVEQTMEGFLPDSNDVVGTVSNGNPPCKLQVLGLEGYVGHTRGAARTCPASLDWLG